jgi:SpoVK/Ycf46/Vps4 family AAA+-type ATPase
MPAEYAIAQSNVARLDRFTARCRVPLRAVRQKPRDASAYVVFRPDAQRAELFLCRAALAQRDVAARCPYDAMVETTTTARPALAKRLLLTEEAERLRVDGMAGMHWIPRQIVHTAGAVTLEVDETSVDGGRVAVQALLADVAYRQLLHETMQHQIAVCRLAVVRLPLPSALRGDGSETVRCRVVSVYPAEEIVRVTATTRVTITLPDRSEETGKSDVVDRVDGMARVAVEDAQRDRVGGLDKELQMLREMILLPVTNLSLQDQYEIEFPKGALLCGPPGVGKTLLVRTAVEDCRDQIPLHLEVINGSEIMTSGIGDAEHTLREIFKRAKTKAHESDGASVIFIDELDALCPKRDAHGTMAHSRIVAQLLTLLDGADKQARENVLIIGATNLPNNIDSALRRPGRFDREIFVAPPDAAAREQIILVHSADLPYVVDGSAEDKKAFIKALAEKAVGYVGADIAALCREALSVASTRQFVELTKSQELRRWWEDWQRHGEALQVSDVEKAVTGIAWRVNPVSIPLWFLQSSSSDKAPASRPAEYFRFLFRGVCQRSSLTAESVASVPDSPVFQVTMDDFDRAMQVIVASALRSASGVARGVEQLGWESIGGQDETKLALQQALEWPLKFPETFSRLGVTPPRGILLYGPPGCSKSTIVRAAASSSGATFLALSAAQVFSPFFGDAEAAVRQVFRDARAALPAIIFFDEIDVLVAKREFDGTSADSGSGSGSTAMRVLSTMLNEMDGVESADGLLVIGATNRPDCIDAALLRPGRFDRILFVDLPTEMDRLRILEIHTRHMTLHVDVDLRRVVLATDFFSGAELEVGFAVAGTTVMPGLTRACLVCNCRMCVVKPRSTHCASRLTPSPSRCATFSRPSRRSRPCRRLSRWNPSSSLPLAWAPCPNEWLSSTIKDYRPRIVCMYSRTRRHGMDDGGGVEREGFLVHGRRFCSSSR